MSLYWNSPISKHASEQSGRMHPVYTRKITVGSNPTLRTIMEVVRLVEDAVLKTVAWLIARRGFESLCFRQIYGELTESGIVPSC
jgi:hypothetical protein